VKLQLMRHLTTLKFPKALDLLYYDNLRGRLKQYKAMLDQQKNPNGEAMSPCRPKPNKK